MLPQRNGLSLQSPLRPLSVLIFHLLLTHSVTGQSHLIGPSQPIVATVGDGIILPCHLEPAVDVAAMMLLWTRSDLDPEFVFVWRFGQDLVHTKHPSYKGRTSLFTDKLKRGNISLKLSDVRPSDAGRYKCFIPDMLKGSFIELVVGAASSPVISLAGIDGDKGGVVLQCESAGWHPEPEVLWLDNKGKLLSAGPTETVRGPDDLYTVSSRVTVEKRHNNSFTCRVQQRNINQIRETHIQVPDNFFKVQSSYAVPVITGLAVSLAVCIVMPIALLLILLWKWRQNIIKTKRRHCDEIEKGNKKTSSQTNKTEDQSVSAEEREHLMGTDTVEMKDLKGKGGKKSKHIKKQRSQQQLLEEQQRREEAEKEVQTLEEELETKKKEVETKQCELQQLHEEKQRNEDELQTLKEELETKNKEGQNKEDQQRREVETLKKQLETKQMDLDTNIKKIDEKQAEVQQLQNQTQRTESNLQTLMETLSENMERHRLGGEADCSVSHGKKKRKKKEKDQLLEEQQRREEAEKEVQTLKEELETKKKEVETKQCELQQLHEEKQRNEDELQTLKEELKKKNKEGQNKEDQQRREVETLKKQLETKQMDLDTSIKKIGEKQAEVQQLQNQMIQRMESNLQTLMETLSNNMESKTNESVPGQHGASSPTRPVIVPGINKYGKYIRLRNTSSQEQQLKNWEIHVQVNNTNPIIYKFDDSLRLKSGETVRMWPPGHHQLYGSSPNNLEWRKLKTWSCTDQLLVKLISSTGEIKHYR
ncbi:hypothetical protein ABVT39_027917 [Epinephelus coioides]